MGRPGAGEQPGGEHTGGDDIARHGGCALAIECAHHDQVGRSRHLHHPFSEDPAQVVSGRFDHPSGIAQGKATTLGVTYEHGLSKRTYLYASYGQVSNNGTSSLPLYGGTTSVAPVVAGDNPRALSLGMRHMF